MTTTTTMTVSQSMSPQKTMAQDTSIWGRALLPITCALALCGLLASCSILNSKPAPALQTYTLGDAVLPADSTPTVQAGTKTVDLPENRLVLLVDVPRESTGYNSNRMVYVRQPLTQEAFTRSVWVDTPARMLGPLLTTHLQQSGLFRAVIQAPSGAQADLRLDTTIVRLQQDFLQLPSRVHVEWQMSLLNNPKREVLAWHRIHVVQLAPSDDAAGGAQAANAATQEALRQATGFLQSALLTLPTLIQKDGPWTRISKV